MDASGANVHSITGNNPGIDAEPRLFPDGARIAYTRYEPGVGPHGGQIAIMNMAGSDLHVLPTPDFSGTPDWSPDGTRIAFVAGTFGIMVMDDDGTHQTAVTSGPGFDSFPKWSPDGTRIAFLSNPGYPTGGVEDIVTVTPDGSNRSLVVPGPVGDFAWQPLPRADTTPPNLTPEVTGTNGENGWYVGDVTVNWRVSDAELVVTQREGCEEHEYRD